MIDNGDGTVWVTEEELMKIAGLDPASKRRRLKRAVIAGVVGALIGLSPLLLRLLP